MLCRTTLAAKDEQMRKALHDLEASLKEEIAKGTSSVRGDAHSVNVVLAERILYDSGSAEIKPGGLKVLRRIAEALRVSLRPRLGEQRPAYRIAVAPDSSASALRFPARDRVL